MAMSNPYTSRMNNESSGNKQNGNNANVDSDSFSQQDTDTLKSIDETLKKLLKNSGSTSQSDARNGMPGKQYNQSKWSTGRRTSSGRSNVTDQFEKGLRDSLLESVSASGFKQSIQGTLKEFADSIGKDVSDLPNVFGQQLGKDIMKKAKSTEAGKSVFGKVDSIKNQASSKMKDAFMQGVKGYDAKNGTNAASSFSKMGAANAKASSAETVAGGLASGTTAAEGMAGAAASAETVSASLAGLGSAAMAAAPYIAAVGVGLIVLDHALDTLNPAIEGTKALFNSMQASGNRYETSRKKNIELAQKRILADTQYMIQEPFDILKDAAQSLYDTWDSQIQIINGSQGYNKSDLQDLISSYAQRLRDEGLSSVISSADISTNLANVLKSGLSGQVAEEFAYLATKLNAAVPTQDFFEYASTYASLAANAIKNGSSQTQAIEYANAEMTQFANNVLYASRQLSGGFSSGLSNAQSLFEDAVKIATASKTGDAATISGVLTSVSAITGAIAPDLASTMVDAVVSAATGGNSSSIVALRSLAGVNASNTEFLKALAEDPQAIFTNLFTNLAKLQNMSNDNFMEVAEGLSSVFGISMDSFARVDFNYLADAISSMNINSSALEENMQLLADGQTTTTAEQLKMAQINQYMIDEGLSYVLDNEAARVIQEHMWDEQLAREQMEAEYGVNLQGAGLEFLEGIMATVENIKNFLNPFSWMAKAINLVGSNTEAAAQRADIAEMLELGKVGKSNLSELYKLTTSNASLNLTSSLVSQMGGVSAYSAASNALNAYNNSLHPLTGSSGLLSSVSDSIGSTLARSLVNTDRNSRYAWTTVGKSTATNIANSLASATNLTSLPSSYTKTSATQAATDKANGRFQEFIDTMGTYVEENKSYEEWKASATKFGISDFDDALDTYGRSEAELKSNFGDREAQKATQYEHERDVQEDKFWASGLNFWDVVHPAWQERLADLEQQKIDLQKLNNDTLTSFFNSHKEFYASWVDYYVKHTAYSKETLNASDVAGVKNAEKKESGDAVLALANALTSNAVDLKDPVVQTNAILAKILLVAESIMQQNNASTGVAGLPNALSALGLGLTK